MAKVTVITPINHDGVLYNPGETLECSAEQAKTLCDLGSAKMAGKTKPLETEETGNEAETTDPPKPATSTAAKPKSNTKGK